MDLIYFSEFAKMIKLNNVQKMLIKELKKDKNTKLVTASMPRVCNPFYIAEPKIKIEKIKT